jgi:hypothetical protein
MIVATNALCDLRQGAADLPGVRNAYDVASCLPVIVPVAVSRARISCVPWLLIVKLNVGLPASAAV